MDFVFVDFVGMGSFCKHKIDLKALKIDQTAENS